MKPEPPGTKQGFPWFQLFKYTVYFLVLLDVFLFLYKEWDSAGHRFSGHMPLSDIIATFTSTIDTAAWVVLLLLFELETHVLSDKQIHGNLKWVLRVIRGACYVSICYAFIGYVKQYFWILDFTPIKMDSLCQYIGNSWMMEIDEFEVITQDNCSTLSNSSDILKKSDQPLFTNLAQWTKARQMVLVDIFNSGAWIIVVAVLEIDIWLQLKSKFTGNIYLISKVGKTILYTILLGAAVCWAYNGDILEFWDAFLWIVAFIFIEKNLFEWQAETT